MKINYLFYLVFLAFLLASCERERESDLSQEDPLLTKISVKLLSPGALPYDDAEMSILFSYDSDKRLTKRTGGFLPTSGSTGNSSGYFTNLITTSLTYNANTVIVGDFSTSPDFSVQKNTRSFTLNAHNQIEKKETPAANPYLFKRDFYQYKNGKLDEIITTFPNMPYDPTDPDDYIGTTSEKFYYDAAGNLERTEFVELQDGVATSYKRVRSFENYDKSYNPFSRFMLLDEYFYRSLSKNNFRIYKETITQYGSTSVWESAWTFNYDASGNIIVH